MTLITESYLNRISEFPGKCAFRGQANSSWKLHPAATRRLVRYFDNDEEILTSSRFPQIHLAYHRAILIDPARKSVFGVDDGHMISDVQLLAELQHFGAATGLMDFTWDPLVAMWFACERNDLDGKVFIVDLRDARGFQRLSSDEATHRAEEIFSPSSNHRELFYCDATVQFEGTPRVLRQRNLFVIGRPLIPTEAVSSIVISASHKVQIRRELEELFDIGELAPFADIQSFSRANSVQSSLQQMEDPFSFQLQGNQSYNLGNYLDAVSRYDRCIELAPLMSENYFLRGNAKAELGDYVGAKDDYDQAVRYKDRPLLNWEPNTAKAAKPSVLWSIYFSRGNVRAAVEDLEGALEDYNEAIRLGGQTDSRDSSLYFNRGNVNTLLHNFDDANRDYQEAISLGSFHALFNRGNLLVSIGCFDEALQCYDESIGAGNDRSDLIYNRSRADAILGRIGGNDVEVRSPRYEGAERRMAIDVSLRDADSNMHTELFNFYGIVGNTGNAGGCGQRGGRGYEGKVGFVVVLQGRPF